MTFLDEKFLGNSVEDWGIAIGIVLGSFIATKIAYWVISNVVKITVPKKEINKVVLMSRIYVSLWLLIIGISLFLNSWLPIIMIILPPFYGNTILMICGMTQHAGLADNVKDHRKSTRTVILNPFFSFFPSMKFPK